MEDRTVFYVTPRKKKARPTAKTVAEGIASTRQGVSPAAGGKTQKWRKGMEKKERRGWKRKRRKYGDTFTYERQTVAHTREQWNTKTTLKPARQVAICYGTSWKCMKRRKRTGQR